MMFSNQNHVTTNIQCDLVADFGQLKLYVFKQPISTFPLIEIKKK